MAKARRKKRGPEKEKERRKPGLPAWMLALAVIPATYLVYVPVWNAGIIRDDAHYRTENPLQSPEKLFLATGTKCYHSLIRPDAANCGEIGGRNP